MKSVLMVSVALAPSLAATTSTSSSSSGPITVPVYVPGYRAENWDDLAGSVITSDSIATTYTVFCPDTQDCEIAGPLPFTFAEGPSTFEYSGAIQDKLTALLSCQLASTTAATCTEYSSFGAKFTKGNTTGPTEFSRTQTYTGSEVQWGVLTLTTPAPAAASATATTGGSSGDDGGIETINPTDTAWFFPSPTSKSWAAASRSGSRGEVVAAVVAGLVVWVVVVMGGGLGAI